VAVSAHQRLVNSRLLLPGHQNLRFEVRLSLPGPHLNAHACVISLSPSLVKLTFVFNYSRYAHKSTMALAQSPTMPLLSRPRIASWRLAPRVICELLTVNRRRVTVWLVELRCYSSDFLRSDLDVQ